MATKYYSRYQPDIWGGLGEGMSNGLIEGMQQAMAAKTEEDKAKKAEELRLKQRLEDLQLLGYQDLTGQVEANTPKEFLSPQKTYSKDDYERFVNFNGKMLGLTLSDREKSKQAMELKKQEAEIRKMDAEAKDPGGLNAYAAKQRILADEGVPGKKLAAEQAAKAEVSKTKGEFVRSQAQSSLDTISEVEKGMGFFGLTGDIPSLGGTKGANWDANMNKLLSGKVIDVMTQMKEASKTGATGFGALSEKELAVLQGAATALKKNLSEADAQRYLEIMKAGLQKIVNGGQPEQSVGSSSVPSVGETFNGEKVLSIKRIN